MARSDRGPVRSDQECDSNNARKGGAMNLYMFQLEDEFNDNWILYYTDATGKLQLKERYEKFQCSVCGKVDELAAL